MNGGLPGWTVQGLGAEGLKLKVNSHGDFRGKEQCGVRQVVAVVVVAVQQAVMGSGSLVLEAGLVLR